MPFHDELPRREGPRPVTTPHAPHSQIDQIPPPAERVALGRALIANIAALPHVRTGGSRRAPWGTVGFHLDPEHARTCERVFLLDQEFAHVHLEDDGSLHAILHEPLRTEAIDAGWAEVHPFAGQPTVSPDTVMLYAPRNDAEVAIISKLVHRSWLNASRTSTIASA